MALCHRPKQTPDADRCEACSNSNLAGLMSLGRRRAEQQLILAARVVRDCKFALRPSARRPTSDDLGMFRRFLELTSSVSVWPAAGVIIARADGGPYARQSMQPGNAGLCKTV